MCFVKLGISYEMWVQHYKYPFNFAWLTSILRPLRIEANVALHKLLCHHTFEVGIGGICSGNIRDALI
jgi:hypothetical protein